MEKYIVRLSAEERDDLQKLVSTGKRAARVLTRARILLLADEGEFGPAQADEQIALSLNVSAMTVRRVRKQLVEEGVQAAIERKSYTIRKSRKKIDGDVEAHLIALSCSDPPDGFERWTLRLLADKAVELQYVDSISHETVRKALKKTN